MPDKTQEVLAEMLVENTGSHMLDSGGAYGRNFERNSGKSVEDFINEPKVFTDKYGPTINVFHYCDHWLKFDEKLDAEFNEWVDKNDEDDSPWLVLMEEFAAYQASIYGESWLGNSTINTYNHENILSQTLQYTTFAGGEWGDDYILLQIHGGCDVRGGYTKPKVFRLIEEGFGWDVDAFSIVTCDDRKGECVTIDYRGGELTHVEYENSWSDHEGVTEIDPNEWVSFYMSDRVEWDEETDSFICPDGDGHFKFEPSFY